MDYPFSAYYLAVLIFWAVVAGIAQTLPEKRSQGVNKVLLAAVGFSFLGLSIGLLSGTSRAPVVDATISGLLALYGGLVVYLFDKKSSDQKTLATMALIIVPLMIQFGSYVGSSYRSIGEVQQAGLNHWYENEAVRYKARVETLMKICDAGNNDACTVLLESSMDTAIVAR